MNRGFASLFALWATIASSQNLPERCLTLPDSALVVFDGEHPCLSDPNTLRLVEEAAEAGNVEAAMLLAPYYSSRGNEAKAGHWMQTAARFGTAGHQLSYAHWLAGHIKTSEDASFAYEQALGAFARGDIDAAYLAASIARTNLKQRETARAWYLMGARGGHKPSMATLVELANDEASPEWERASAVAFSHILAETYPEKSYNRERYSQLGSRLFSSLSPDARTYAKRFESKMRQKLSGKLHE